MYLNAEQRSSGQLVDHVGCHLEHRLRVAAADGTGEDRPLGERFTRVVRQQSFGPFDRRAQRPVPRLATPAGQTAQLRAE